MAMPVVEVETSKRSIEVPYPPYDVGYKETQTHRIYSFGIPRVVPEAKLLPNWEVKIDKPEVDLVQEGFVNIKEILLKDTFYSSSGRGGVHDIPWQSKRVFGLFGYMNESSIKNALGYTENQEMDLKQVEIVIPKGIDEFTAEDKAQIAIDYTMNGIKCHSVIKLFQTYIRTEEEVGGIATNVYPEMFSRADEMRREFLTVNGLLCWDAEITTSTSKNEVAEVKKSLPLPSRIRERLKSMGIHL